MKQASILLLSALLSGSCASDIADMPGGETPGGAGAPLSVTAAISGTTRMAGTAFEAGDEIGVTCATTSSGGALPESDAMYRFRNMKYVMNSDGSFEPGEQGGIFMEDEEVRGYTAYFPFTGVEAMHSEKVLNTAVSQSKETKRKYLDILVSQGAQTKGGKGANDNKLLLTGEHAFKRVMTKVTFRVFLDRSSFKDYEADGLDMPLYDTYLDYCTIRVKGLIHTAGFSTDVLIPTINPATDVADNTFWDIEQAGAERISGIATPVDFGLPTGIATGDRYLGYETILIPQMANITLALANFKDNSVYVSKKPLQIFLEPGNSYIINMKVGLTRGDVDGINVEIADWEEGGNGQVQTPQGNLD